MLALDAGSHCIRLLLLESRLDRLRVLHQDTLDLQAEGLVSADELRAHLQTTIARWGRPPLALTLPQSMAVSQIVDLPPVPDAEARQLIEAETIKLGGVNESIMVYDFARVPLSAENRQSFWVTFCQEGRIESLITRLGIDDQVFREITTDANALLTAWQRTETKAQDAVLIQAGGQNTTLVIVREGIGVFAASFPMAGDYFTRAIARRAEVSPAAAEELKRSTNLLAGPSALAGFSEVVDGWAEELQRQLHEACEPPARLPDRIIALGGTFEQPGLREYLTRKTGLNFQPWPADTTSAGLRPSPGFEIALGAALQALGQSQQPASLLPARRRTAWKNHLARQRLQFANAILLAACFVALALGIWQKINLIQRQQALTEKVQAGIEQAQVTRALNLERLHSYDELRPLFEGQQTTMDTLQTLALLQAAHSNSSLWYVLIADQASYFALPPPAPPTNNAPFVGPELDYAGRRREATNASPAHPGLIAELSVAEDAVAARNTMSLVVNHLKQSPIFARVDLLSEDLRRNLADPKVILSDRHFTLTLDFAATNFQSSANGSSTTQPSGGRTGRSWNRP